MIELKILFTDQEREAFARIAPNTYFPLDLEGGHVGIFLNGTVYLWAGTKEQAREFCDSNNPQ